MLNTPYTNTEIDQITNHISYDSACEIIRENLDTAEADALIDTAFDQRKDGRSARDLAVEFNLDTLLGMDEAIVVIKSLQ